MEWCFQWLAHSITPWVILKESALDLVDAVPTEASKSFLDGPGKSIQPVVLPEVELNPLTSRWFNFSPETSNYMPLHIFPFLVLELNSIELCMRTVQMLRKLLQVTLEDELSSVA